jgi:Polysaccharide biosynthesis protein
MSAPAGDIASPAAEDVLSSGEAGGRVIRGSAWRVGANGVGIVLGLATATLLLRHLGVAESGRYVTVLSLVAIPVYVADIGLNVTGSREMALRGPEDRPALIANILGQRLAIMPVGVLLIVAFAALAGYPTSMVVGSALAGTGVFIVALANVLLLPLTVELRNAGLALVDFTKQLVGLTGVALLVALGARLTPFFAVQLVVGLVVVALVPLLTGPRAFVLPRFDRAEQRVLMRTAFPLATALALGQVYFRLVIVLMSLISNPEQTGYFGGSLRAMENVVIMPILVAGVALRDRRPQQGGADRRRAGRPGHHPRRGAGDDAHWRPRIPSRWSGAAHSGGRASVHRALPALDGGPACAGSPTRAHPHQRAGPAGSGRLRRRAGTALRRQGRRGRQRARRRPAGLADLLETLSGGREGDGGPQLPAQGRRGGRRGEPRAAAPDPGPPRRGDRRSAVSGCGPAHRHGAQRGA